MKIILSLLLAPLFALAKVDYGKAINDGVQGGLGAVGGWLILGIIIACIFAWINGKMK